MGGRRFRCEGKISKALGWAEANWQILLFWFACAFAGWYLGARGYGTALYFRIAGINPEEWTPLLRLTAKKDPRVGSIVFLKGLTDWQGKPVKLPFPDKITALFFICGSCGLEERLELAWNFQNRYNDKVRLAVVYIGQPDAEFYRLLNKYKELTFVRDPQLRVFERLNALYMPRLYLVASNGTLQYLSPLAGHFWGIERWQEELEHIGKLLGR